MTGCLKKIFYSCKKLLYLFIIANWTSCSRRQICICPPPPCFCYFEGLSICNLQAQKVTHIVCFLYLKKSPVAPKLVLVASLIWLLDPIVAAVWPWILVQPFYFFFSLANLLITTTLLLGIMTSTLRHNTWDHTFVSTEEISFDIFFFLGVYSVSHNCDLYLLTSNS